MSPDDALQQIFVASRKARAAEKELMAASHKELVPLLTNAVAKASSGDELVLLADLCAQIPGPEMCDALLSILDSDSPAVRVEAGEAIRDVAYARFKEVALSIERAIDRGDDGVAMQELPFVLAQIHDPDPLNLMVRFLEHEKADIVGAAIEALSSTADPNAIPHIEKLVDDTRTTVLEDMDDAPIAIGVLARVALLEEFGMEEHDPSAP